MYQLLLVDDEASVVDSLALTIPWEDYAIEVVHRAYSAKQALQIAKHHAIDIMITDIRMPEMNGIQLIEAIKEFNSKIRAIILSGHDEFDYAQQAITQGAIRYLLKPIKLDQLTEAVTTSIKSIEKEWEEISSYQQIKHALHANKPLLKSQFLLDLLSNKTIINSLLEERLAVLDLNIKIGDPFVLMVARLEKDFSEYDVKSLSLLEFAISNIAEEVFQDLFTLWSCITEQGYIVFLIMSKEKENLNLADSYAVKLQNHVQKYLRGSISLCLSEQACFSDKLSEIYRACVSSINRNIGKNKSFFLIAEELKTQTKYEHYHLYEPPLLSTLLDSGNWDEATVKIQRILMLHDENAERTEDQLFTILLYISSAFVSNFNSDAMSVDEWLGEDFLLMLRKKSQLSRQRIWEWSNRIILNMREQNALQIEDSHQQIAAKVRTYIQAHLSEGVSLQTIADYIKLHPVYLAKVYKLATGETIGNYMYQLRMERAVHLLTSTELKISEVSNQLGFLTPPYFIKLFKKQYGCTPQEYRNQLQS